MVLNGCAWHTTVLLDSLGMLWNFVCFVMLLVKVIKPILISIYFTWGLLAYVLQLKLWVLIKKLQLNISCVLSQINKKLITFKLLLTQDNSSSSPKSCHTNGVIPVSYTHLDVYKRQKLNIRTLLATHSIYNYLIYHFTVD